jgi:hypothetical protein
MQNVSSALDPSRAVDWSARLCAAECADQYRKLKEEQLFCEPHPLPPAKIQLRTWLRNQFAAVIRAFRIPKRLNRASRFDAPSTERRRGPPSGACSSLKTIGWTIQAADRQGRREEHRKGGAKN